jgi:hypothetical protein
MPDRPWQSRGQLSLPLWWLLGSAISNAATGHTSLFALSVVNRAVTSNATLRPAGADRARGAPSVTGRLKNPPDNATGMVADDRCFIRLRKT